MKRDAAVPALAALLVLPALPVAGLVPSILLPTTPASYYPVALGLCVVFFIGVAPVRGRAPYRPLTLALAAAPFLVFAVVEGGGRGALGLPAIGWFLTLAAATAIGLAPRRRYLLGALLVVLLGGGAVLAAGDVEILPNDWNPVRHPVPARSGGEAPAPHPERNRSGPRAGAPVRLARDEEPVLGRGPGPWWVRAAHATRPGPRPLVLLLDGRQGGAAAGSWLDGDLTLVAGEDRALDHSLDLVAYDAVVVRERAWGADDRRGRARAAALAGFVSGGGLLIGPAPGRPWPPHLGRALRAAGAPQPRGVEGVRAFGLGRIARAGSKEDAAALLAARLWVPRADTAFGRHGNVPPVPAAFARWQDDPGGRRVQGALLICYVALLFAFAWLVRRPGARLLTVLLAAATAAVGVVWLSPRDPGYRLHGLAVDLGGAGGRRFEALLVSAGPRGFQQPVHWSGGGVVSLHGARLTPEGSVAVPPGRTAWVIRERVGIGVVPGDVEDRRSAFLRTLLVGEVETGRLRYGRLPVLPVHVEDAGAVPAVTLLYRAPPP